MSTTKGSSRSGSPYRPLAVLLALMLAGIATMIGVDAMKPRLAIDLAGGTSVTLTAKPLPEEEGGTGSGISDEAIDQAVKIIRQRVNGFGVSEAQVTTLGSDNIVVSVPGQNNNRIVEQVGQTALLRFRPVLQVGAPTGPGGLLPDLGPITDDLLGDSGDSGDSGGDSDSNRALAGALRSADDGAGSDAGAGAGDDADAADEDGSAAKKNNKKKADDEADEDDAASADDGSGVPAAIQRAFTNLDCTDPAARQGGDQEPADAIVVACDRDGLAKYLLGPSGVQGTQVSNAEAGLPQGAGVGAWLINMDFDGSGTRDFADLTGSVVGLPSPQNQIAIVLDGVVYSSPQVNSEIPDGRAVIEGNFTSETARDLANVLKYGALPLAFEKSTINTISASLGDDQLNAGLIAGALGMVLVLVYGIFYYRGLGAAALFGLIIAAGFAWIAVSLLGEGIGYRLSLAGVAGLIVAIGITADSFVVYFERLRDEIREGRTPRAAAEYGWARARRTIISANFVQLLAAAVLYYFSVADVKGFAFTLGLVTIIDVMVIFLYTKPIVTLLMRRPYFARGQSFSGVSRASLGMPPAPVARPKGA